MLTRSRFLSLGVVAALATMAQAKPTHRVFGYAYAGDTTTSWNWDLLTDIAFFSEPMHTDGTLPTTTWSTSGKTMVTAAHAHQVRCMLTVNLFNPSGVDDIHAFLSSSAAVAAGSQAIADAVMANGADGVNLDFEFVSSGDKAAFVTFVQAVATKLHAAVPGSEVSIAMPSVTYPGYDITALSTAADTLMIMAYDFHYQGSNPGPVAPLADSTLWGAGSQASSIALFKGKVADPSHLLVGMPLYGYDYHATSSAVPATKTSGSTATALTWKTTETDAPIYGRQWDSASSTPYYIYADDAGVRQTFYEDPESLGDKIDQVVASGVGGIGLWELSYASPSFWTVVQAKLAAVPDPDAGAPESDAGTAAPEDAPQGCGCSVARRSPVAPTGMLLGLGLLAVVLIRNAGPGSGRAAKPSARDTARKRSPRRR